MSGLVLEKVPVNTPSTWCSRMVVCVKKLGKARRTVDFKAVNRAASIPSSCLHYAKEGKDDNGYHSCPIDERDRHVTTFLTLWGCYRYQTTPQGFSAAGDGYWQRYNLITSEVQNVKRCVDDSCLWEDTIEEQFLATCRYLTGMFTP
jgi:hypothetical protein